MFNRPDVRTSVGPWVLKMTYGDGQIMILRYPDFNSALDFSQAVDYYFGSEVRISIMSYTELERQAAEFNQPDLLKMVEDVYDASDLGE